MEVLLRLGSLLSPSFFAILAGLSLTAAAVLFIAAKRNITDTQVKGVKLSKLEPPEYRGTAYLVLAFGWSIFGLILSFIFAAVSPRVWGMVLLVSLSLLCLLFTLCFLCAGGGVLLRVVTEREGGTAYWFFSPVRYIDPVVVWFGDLLTTGVFRQPWFPETVIGRGSLDSVGEETPAFVMSGHEKVKVAEDMERLHHRLSRYEATLPLEQRERLLEMRSIAEELRIMHP